MDYIQTYNYTDTGSLETITSYLEGKEDYIKNTYPFLNDFGTGLTENDISTRAGGYNIFSMSSECPELDDLLLFFGTSYLHYIDNVLPNKTFTNDQINPAIMCWLNVIRKSEKIGMHKHAEDYGNLWSFISGTFVLKASNTNTNYSYNGELETISNIQGQLTLFPPFYSHWTDLHTDTTSRLTLGLDILFNKDGASGDSSFYNNLIEI